MTNFSRRGHYRTYSSGKISWVQKHMVSRSVWGDNSNNTKENSFLGERQYYLPIRESSNNSSPQPLPIDIWGSYQQKTYNARCPICGKNVFYYTNTHGSAVFFDELGPPWPKHPCISQGKTILFPKGNSTIPFKEEKWRKQGWMILRSAQIFRTTDGEYVFSGYSKGKLLGFLICDVQGFSIKDFSRYICHYRNSDSDGRRFTIGVLDQDEIFHQLPARSTSSDTYKNLSTLNHTYLASSQSACTEESHPKFRQIKPQDLVDFSGEKFLATPNAMCKNCGKWVYVYRFKQQHLDNILVLDNNCPPWGMHQCCVTIDQLILPYEHEIMGKPENNGWKKFLLKEVIFMGISEIILKGYSKGQKFSIKIMDATQTDLEKFLTLQKLAHFHFFEKSSRELLLGFYVPGKGFFKYRATSI